MGQVCQNCFVYKAIGMMELLITFCLSLLTRTGNGGRFGEKGSGLRGGVGCFGILRLRSE